MALHEAQRCPQGGQDEWSVYSHPLAMEERLLLTLISPAPVPHYSDRSDPPGQKWCLRLSYSSPWPPRQPSVHAFSFLYAMLAEIQIKAVCKGLTVASLS